MNADELVGELAILSDRGGNQCGRGPKVARWGQAEVKASGAEDAISFRCGIAAVLKAEHQAVACVRWGQAQQTCQTEQQSRGFTPPE